MADEYVGEDERVRLMMEKDEVTCTEKGHTRGVMICTRCGIPLPREPWVSAEWEADLWDEWRS